MRQITNRKPNRRLGVEKLERREVYASDFYAGVHNSALPGDVNNDSQVSSLDALIVINELSRQQRASLSNGLIGGVNAFSDVNNDGVTTPTDAQQIVESLARDQVQAKISAPIDSKSTSAVDTQANKLGSGSSSLLSSPPAILSKAPGVGTTHKVVFNPAETVNADNLMSASDAKTLLDRASKASSSTDAIIAIVDRTGRILGVRVEDGVNAALKGDPKKLAFAIDGAVAKARTAAFFSNNEAPLTSRTVRFISQSTMTQREVESWSGSDTAQYSGPGFVAPIGVGGHFPPQTNFTPQVDLFAIEHQSRDSQTHAGADGVKGNADDFTLNKRFNANEEFIPTAADDFFDTWPESYGATIQSADPEIRNLQSRGIATLPGGVPLYKTVVNASGTPIKNPVSASVNLVGGIGVFFPGEDGFATHEQGFVHASERNGVPQTEAQRTSAAKVVEAEFIALAAAAGGGIVGPKEAVRDVSFVNNQLPAAPRFVALNGRIDLVGISLEIYGPTPTRANRAAGIDQVLGIGRRLGVGAINGDEMPVNVANQPYRDGQGVPIGWLVAPHASSDSNGPTAAEVEKIIRQGVAQANATRAAIRLNVDNNFRPGARTKMVLAVADTNGELLGLYRMSDATVFSIDVAIAKARNTAYYADRVDLLPTDRLDFNDDGVFGTTTSSLKADGDTLPLGTAASNRTFRFIVEPRFPTGTELPANAAQGLVNDANLTLRDQKPAVARIVGPESILQMPGINPKTGENLVDNNPLVASIYTDPNNSTILSFASFVPSRNFRDPGDASVIINGTATAQPLANQNGIVFFPGSTSLYRRGNSQNLLGGFGVSGDGVDQDDVVTASGQVGFAPPQAIRADNFTVGRVRLPFQKYNRNPLGM
jgi:uncharacterized protein GlcG (DUF336 family)